MLSTLNVVQAYQDTQAQTARNVARVMQNAWNSIPKDANFWDNWFAILPDLSDQLTMAQYEEAMAAANYVRSLGSVYGIDVPDQLVASAFLTPTDKLQAGLTSAPATATTLMRGGVDQSLANLAGLNNLVRFAHTFTQDAGREATRAYGVATPMLNGYYRKLELPSCDRCAILAGKWFKANADFNRHPQCDCSSIPAVEKDQEEENRLDPVEALRNGQVTNISQADRKAILEDGADIYQVINAKRGKLQKADLYGQNMRVTRSSTTKRGAYFVPGTSRLRPDAIYKVSGDDKAKARELLAKYGYIN